ncbi:polyphosphate kinase 1 [Flavihumibacter solisilvae]|uniref:Polyphosphate kinase n=1 Tax=Flavihumibacter solisilvae TaxID=1349421 RepID=A0A0C1IUE7_9BACT|nr:polyphosphate kinase 1 [Flavihumibacter solisilvae]KIC94104.1 polyphosphate kinase [Flavihumibacter solisilvae]
MYTFNDRDLSWLSFNERVLMEAGDRKVPLLERIKFLSIYSSNLDEFYRVRIPALMALARIKMPDKKKSTAGSNAEPEALPAQVSMTVSNQLDNYGHILREGILPELKTYGIHLVYNEPLPEVIHKATKEYFFNQVLGTLTPVDLQAAKDFFPENNHLYALLVLQQGVNQKQLLINIPVNQVPRFFSVNPNGIQYIIFLEDLIRAHIGYLYSRWTITGFYNLKVTRDAELSLEDEYTEDLVEKMEKQIARRDFGLATRLLYDGRLPDELLKLLVAAFRLENANLVSGGPYHNLKDFASLPVHQPGLSYGKWQPHKVRGFTGESTLLEYIAGNDLMIHPPYHSFDLVLRFFNEAAMDPDVTEIYTTLYRVAEQSKIVNALISAARNGKKVTVLVELKARFDEANNIRWAKMMKAAGVKLHYSPTSLKVHAKTALVKKQKEGKTNYSGLFSTGNLNESTARFYTDHVLFTSHKEMLQELEQLFIKFGSRKDDGTKEPEFRYLLVAKYNLKKKFLQLIDREIRHAREGKPASIRIKLNNLEERDLISKLYDASLAGVKIELLVRGICCLKPGVPNMSSNISVKRIVSRFLEHGRIFIFHNDGKDDVYLGSADWMNRNIYRRIEVCFPVHDAAIRQEVIDLVKLQLGEESPQNAVYQYLR